MLGKDRLAMYVHGMCDILHVDTDFVQNCTSGKCKLAKTYICGKLFFYFNCPSGQIQKYFEGVYLNGSFKTIHNLSYNKLYSTFGIDKIQEAEEYTDNFWKLKLKYKQLK